MGEPSDDWFLTGPGGGAPGGRVYCFPHAGGNPRAFVGWQAEFGPDAELVAVRYPRGGRTPERPTDDGAAFDAIADGVAAAILAAGVEPVYLFGHSLGALLAFEVARRLRDADRPPRHLVASGCSAPTLMPTPRMVAASRLTGRAFAEAVGFLGGLPDEVMADQDLLDLLLPGLIADVRLAAGYRYRPAPPLDLDVSLMAGRDDPHVHAAQLEPWRRECRSAPVYHWADGGHFYFEQRPSAVVDVLRELIRADQHVELI